MWHALLADGRAHRSNERGVRLGRQHLTRSSSTSSLQPLALSLPKSESSTRTSANSVEWQLGSRVPQTGNVLLQRVGQSAMRLLGWQFAGSFPNHAQFVAVVAPHTSNWDFVILLAAKWALQLDARWMGKDAIFRPPLGWILRALGGIPIRRGTSHNVVDASILAFGERPQLVLVLAPEGTRKFVAHWKSGFWHIAHGAKVPIVCIALDYGRKTIRLGPEFLTDSDDTVFGIARIRAAYEGVLGRRPELHG